MTDCAYERRQLFSLFCLEDNHRPQPPEIKALKTGLSFHLSHRMKTLSSYSSLFFQFLIFLSKNWNNI